MQYLKNCYFIYVVCFLVVGLHGRANMALITPSYSSGFSGFPKALLFFWLHWVFVALHRFSLVAVSGGATPLCCAGFSLLWLPLLRITGSRCTGSAVAVPWALEHGLSGCGAWALPLHSKWDLPGSGIKPCALHWQAGSQGKSQGSALNSHLTL